MRVSYKSATERAYEVLLLNEEIEIPINPNNIKLENIIINIFSMQEWAKMHNISIVELTKNGKCKEGYTEFYKKGTKEYAFIFYNEDIESKGRKKFTIAHELGHIALGHKSRLEEYEKEADTFASQLLLPHCILEELIKRGKGISEDYLQETFGLSKQAATISKNNVGKKMDKNAVAEYEDTILLMFKDFISKETINTRYRDYDEYEEMEKERDSWR